MGFPLLDGRSLQFAAKEIGSKFGDEKITERAGKAVSKKRRSDVKEMAQELHRDVAVPLQKALKALRKGEDATLLKKETWFGYEVRFIQVGKRVHTVMSRDRGYERDITIMPSRPLADFNSELPVGALFNNMFKAAGERGLKEAAKIRVTRANHAGTTHLELPKVSRINNVSYAWALYEAANALVQLASGPIEVETEKRAAQSLGLTPRPAYLASTAAGASKPYPALPVPAGSELVDIQQWKGRFVALTTRPGSAEAMQVWIEAGDAPELYWKRIPTPDSTDFPLAGARLGVAGNELKVIGGVVPPWRENDDLPDTTSFEWTYDLDKGTRDGYAAVEWAGRLSLLDSSAFAGVSPDGNLVVGGVAGFHTTKRGAEAKIQTNFKGLRRVYGGWRRLDGAPTDLGGSQTVEAKGYVFFAPGRDADGKVAAFGCNRDEWYLLPDLPEVHRGGDILLSDPERWGLDRRVYGSEVLIHTGGNLVEDGSASKDIYALNLNSLDGTWEKVGESDYVAGRTRVIERGGKLFSFMVGKKGSAAFTVA